MPWSRVSARSLIAAVLILGIGASATASNARAEVWTTIINALGFARALTVAPDGTTFWVGEIGNSTTNLLKAFANDGTETYSKKLANKHFGQVIASSPDSATVVIAGSNDAKGANFLAAHRASSGKELWRTEPPHNIDAIVVAADGSIYAAGSRNLMVSVTKFDADGNVLWTRDFDTGRAASGSAIGIDPKTGGVVVAGTSGTLGPGDPPIVVDLVIVFYDAEGKLKWSRTRTYKGDSIVRIGGVHIDPKSKFAHVTGELFLFPDPDTTLVELFFQRFKMKNGKAKKEKRYDPTGVGNLSGANSIMAPNGKTFYMGAGGILEAGAPFSAMIFKLNNKGKQQSFRTVAIDDATTTLLSLGMDPGGDIIFGGQTGENGQGVYVRRESE